MGAVVSASASVPFRSVLIVSPLLAVRVARALELLMAEDRRNGCPDDPDVAELQTHLDALLVTQVPLTEPRSVPVDSARALLRGETVMVAEAAQLLGTSERWVRRLCADEQLAAERAGRTWLIDKEALMQHIEDRGAA